MASPWDAFPVVQQPHGAAPQGDPVIARDPYKIEDQAMARDAAARAKRDQDMQEQRFQATQQREDARDKRAAEKDNQSSESERTAGFLAGRLVDSVTQLGIAAKKTPGAQAPEWGAELARKVTGSDTAANLLTSTDRQIIRAKQMDILDAALTLGTGAAYNAEQLTGYSQSYLPQIGDDPATVASKRQSLRNLLVEAAKKAGNAAPDVQRALAALDAIPDIPTGEEDEGLTGTVTDEAEVPPVAGGAVPPASPGGGTPPSGLEAITTLAKQGATLGFSDEAAGIGGAISSIFTGEDTGAAYARERDASRAEIAAARKVDPGYLGTAAEFLGGGAAAKIAPAINSLGSIVRQGSALGGAGGFGYGEGAQGSALGGLGGAVAGAGLGAAFHGAGNALARRAAPPATLDREVVAAGQRQNIPIRQPDARPELRNQMSAIETSEHGGPVVRSARAGDEAAIEARVSEVGGQGDASDPYALGSKIQGAGDRYIARTKVQANRLYDRARQKAGSATVQPTEAVAAIDQHIAELKSAGANSNAGQIGYLEGLRGDMSKPLTIEAVQNLRTNMRGQLSERGLTGTDAERRVAQVIDAANQDLTRDLPQSASTALRAADNFYREKQAFIKGTLQQFMKKDGSISPETAARRLASMAQGKGNHDRFSSMWGQLEPAEQADVAATIASSLGRKVNGEFSAATLIRSLDPEKGVNPRTARMVFGDKGAEALADLRTIARAKTDTQASLNNSRTGATVSKVTGGLKTLLMGALGFSAAGPGGAAAGAVGREFISKWGEQRAARMLLNPDFTKWLKNAPNTTNPRAIDQYFSRLAGSSSISANDNQAFTQALVGSLKQSPATNLAAEEQN